jgi:hypothetical protein
MRNRTPLDRRVRCLVPLLLVVALAGCGIRPTGVVYAGGPAAGVAAGPRLFFVKDGRLRPYVRRIGKLGDLPESVRQLLAGPPAGMTTDLPAGLRLTSVVSDGGGVHVRLAGATQVPARGVHQIVCTVSDRYAATSAGNPPFAVFIEVPGHLEIRDSC